MGIEPPDRTTSFVRGNMNMRACGIHLAVSALFSLITSCCDAPEPQRRSAHPTGPPPTKQFVKEQTTDPTGIEKLERGIEKLERSKRRIEESQRHWPPELRERYEQQLEQSEKRRKERQRRMIEEHDRLKRTDAKPTHAT